MIHFHAYTKYIYCAYIAHILCSYHLPPLSSRYYNKYSLEHIILYNCLYNTSASQWTLALLFGTVLHCAQDY